MSRMAISTENRMLVYPKPVLIPTELIQELHFPKEDVLQLVFDKLARRKDLEQAYLIYASSESNVIVEFEDIEGIKKVHTQVVGITDTDIKIPANISLPIHRISNIKF